MKSRKLLYFFLFLCVITKNQCHDADENSKNLLDLKIALSIGNLFGVNIHQKCLDSPNSKSNVTELIETSKNTNSSDLLNAILQRFGNLEEQIKTLQARQIKVGTSYIRWGRKKCAAENTELVYSGYAGGSGYLHTGAAVDYVCLPPDKLNFSTANYATNFNNMCGAEYEFKLSSLNDHNVPCAVCLDTRYTTTVMIPARSQCYDGWETIYHGDLMAGNIGHPAASSFACLDSDPEIVPGGNGSQGGKLFYPVKAQCGSLKCPPYIHDYILTCVVCGK